MLFNKTSQDCIRFIEDEAIGVIEKDVLKRVNRHGINV